MGVYQVCGSRMQTAFKERDETPLYTYFHEIGASPHDDSPVALL